MIKRTFPRAAFFGLIAALLLPALQGVAQDALTRRIVHTNPTAYRPPPPSTAGPGRHQKVWLPVERTMTTQKNYPVVHYDEV